MKISWIAMGAAVGLLAWTSLAKAQQAAEAPPVSDVRPIQGVVEGGAVSGIEGGIEGQVIGGIEGQITGGLSHEYPSAPVVGSAPAEALDPSFQPHPYSYYTVFPEPARTYVGLGEVDRFPFHGQIYGRPSDRWSWTGMMGDRSAGLDRYYYQILP